MKKIISIIIILTIMLVSCKKTKQDTVEDLLTATNKLDKEKLGELLSDSLIYTDENGIPNNKSAYLKLLDSLKVFEIKSKIISVNKNSDSSVNTIEKYSTILDTLLLKSDTVEFLIYKNYLFQHGKIISIKVDTINTHNKFQESLNDRLKVLFIIASEKHNETDKETIYQNIKEYLSEYSQLSTSEKKAYLYHSYVQGTFILNKSNLENNDNTNKSTTAEFKHLSQLMTGLGFKKLTFKGKKTVVVQSSMLGAFDYDTVLSYELDDNYIKINIGNGNNFLLQIIDRNNLESQEYGIKYYRIK